MTAQCTQNPGIAILRKVGSNGCSARAFDQGDTLLVRLEEHTYQTAGPVGRRPRRMSWGIFVLPRREPFGRIVVQHDTQNLIGGAAIWEELCRFDGPGAPSPTANAQDSR